MAGFTERVRHEAPQDSTYQKLVERVKEGTTRRYWLENQLLHFTRGKLYMPSSKLRRELLKETHDTKWVGHPGEERTLALLARSFHWPKMKKDCKPLSRHAMFFKLTRLSGRRKRVCYSPYPFQKDHGSVYR